MYNTVGPHIIGIIILGTAVFHALCVVEYSERQPHINDKVMTTDYVYDCGDNPQ